jgi:hypothetical protein
LRESDIGPLHKLATSEEIAFRWRLRGSTPPLAQFAELLWAETLVQFVLCEEGAEQRPRGLVQCYRADLRNRHAHLSVLVDPEAQMRGWPLEPVLLFVDYLFKGWPLHKLYVEGYDFNVARFAGLARFAEEEGRLLEYGYHDERYHDLVVLALYRERFREHAYPWLDRIRAAVEARSGGRQRVGTATMEVRP